MDISSLNDRQREAVASTEGALLVLAGAGSGKTRVLTYRIAYIVEEKHVSPYSVLALTFTNKAAAEMKERLTSLIGDSAEDMWVSTFHSFCVRVLRYDGIHAGLARNFTIYDESAKKSVISTILKRMGIGEENKTLEKAIVCRHISDAKNNDLQPERYLRELERGSDLIAIYREYQKALKIANALDFDDLILTTLQLFNDCSEVLDKYRRKFRYVLVDEYQDTNMAQYELIRLLCQNVGNLCVVGDDDQSIYGWRGATIRNILEFENDFPNAKVIKLEQNYRSTENILKAANAVIANNCERKGKNLWTKDLSGAKIIHHTAYDERDEAKYIAREIERAVDLGAHYKEYAILYRTNAQSRVLESTFAGFAIPFRVYGGMRFYERMEISDILAYIRIIVNPNDNAAFKRAVNIPPRGIGAKTISALENLAADNDVSMLEAMRSPSLYNNLPASARLKLDVFSEIIDELMLLRDKSESDTQFVSRMIKVINYDGYLSTYDEATYENRIENLEELVGSIAETESDLTDDSDALALFLENAALVSDTDDLDENADAVSLMTIHSAKGLEFFTVFLAGFEEDLFPTTRSKSDPDKLEEERRLCYVAITRARRKLYLINCAQRRLYNQTANHDESRFLSEIPDNLLIHTGVERAVSRHSLSTSQWLSGNSGNSQTAGYTTGRDMTQGSARHNDYYRQQTVKTPQTHKAAAQPTKPLPSNTAKPAHEYCIGARVRHPKFGEGTVTDVFGNGTAASVTVELDTGETKKFAAQYAPLEEID